MMRNVCVLVVLAIIPFAPRAGAQGVPEPEQFSLRLEGRLWGPSLSAELQATASQPGTLIDIPKDLGVGDKSTFEVRATVQLGIGHKIRVGYTQLDYDGDIRLNRQIRFEETVYPRFTRVVTSLKGSYFAGDYEWDFTKGTYGYVGALFGAKFFDFDALLAAPEQGDRDVETLRIPVPVVGLVARGYYSRFSVSGELTGFTIGSRANFTELHLGTHFDVTKNVGLQFGYRLLKIHGEQSNDLIDMRLSGLQFGGQFSF
jgi:hypothetical protein